MFNKIFYVPFLFILCISVNAQFPDSGSIYNSARVRARSPQERQIMREIYNENFQFNRLRSFSERNNSSNRPDSSYTTVADTLPRSLTDKAKKYIVPDETLKAQNKNFLKLPNTGIVKMLPEKACQVDTGTSKKGFFNLMEQCPYKFINGHGKYFSFRQKDYVVSRLADIGIHDNWIFSLGFFNQGVMVNIGDIPLEQVSLSTKGADFLNGLLTSTEIPEIDKRFQEFENGVVNENLNYQKVLPLELEKTYVLRVTAYNIAWFQEQETSIGKIKIYPLKEDKRKDILIAFRIINRDDEGNTTLIWKELQSKNSPKLEVPK